MLTENLKKSELSVAYLHAVATVKGFKLDVPRIDDDSVDVEVRCSGLLDGSSVIQSPSIQIQLKATSKPDFYPSGDYKLQLKAKNYHDLSGNTQVPRLLVLLHLPEDPNLWLTHSPDELILRRCAYFLNLKGMPAITTNSLNVQIPVANVLSPDQLYKMMLQVSQTGSL